MYAIFYWVYKMFYDYGYYIVKPSSRDEWMRLGDGKIISISHCLCEVYPNLREYFFVGDDDFEYAEKLNISKKELSEMKDITLKYIDDKIDCLDFHFYNLENAKEFNKLYLRNVKDLKIAGISIEDKYIDTITEESTYQYRFMYKENAKCEIEKYKKKILDKPHKEGEFIVVV